MNSRELMLGTLPNILTWLCSLFYCLYSLSITWWLSFSVKACALVKQLNTFLPLVCVLRGGCSQFAFDQLLSGPTASSIQPTTTTACLTEYNQESFERFRVLKHISFVGLVRLFSFKANSSLLRCFLWPSAERAGILCVSETKLRF